MTPPPDDLADTPDESAPLENDETIAIADDPVLGRVLASHPSDRVRLLIIGGAIYGAGALLINLVFLPVDAEAALLPVVTLMAALALAVGWYLLHYWNREIVFFERGFSYREGSHTAYIPYADVRALHLEAERISYLGGLIKRTVRRFTIKTIHDETILVRGLYRRIDALIARMEALVNAVLRPRIQNLWNAGGQAAFGARVGLSAEGIHVDGQLLPWVEYAGHGLSSGQLILKRHDGSAFASAPLESLENETLLIELLRQRKPNSL